MIKRLLILTLCVLLFQEGWTQSSGNRKPRTSAPKKGAGENAANQPKQISVLFATNDDCDLFINEQLQSTVRKSGFTYINLAPGNYTYTAKSKATGDELLETITVSKDGINEVFIDMLFVVDERTALRAKQNQTSSGLALINTDNPGDKSPNLSEEIKLQKTVGAVANFLLYNMVSIKGGSFIMGNNRSPFADEKEHKVGISPFYFSKYEITQHQWQIVMGYNPSLNKGCDYCPVENVSWNEVQKFIEKLNAVSGKKFRLPTEAEWEYVSRMGGREEIETAGGPEEYIRKTAWHFQNSNAQTHQIGMKEPNAAGIFDLMGNVSEWCQDWYSPNLVKDKEEMNPTGAGSGKEKVVRGGNYKDYSANRFRPSLRHKRIPAEKASEIGFRLVLDAK
ncbi:MAG TPA: SUMF1/EgtB/PvdO family nonheme iron enzyme [Flavisolibacter sp.]